MGPNSDNLSKDDLFLLLESYKNSVEMNTIISQQLTSILSVLEQCRNESDDMENNLSSKIDSLIQLVEKIKEIFTKCDKENVKYFEKVLNKVNLLYVFQGSIVVSLIWMIYQLIEKYELLRHIAENLGVS